MKNVYILAILSLFAGQIFAQGTAIKRASLSTSVANAHSIQNGQYKVQQSIAHMGIMGSITHDSHTMTRGFLLPQMGAPAEKPITTLKVLALTYTETMPPQTLVCLTLWRAMPLMLPTLPLSFGPTPMAVHSKLLP